MRAKYRLAPAYQSQKLPFNLGGIQVVFDGAEVVSLPPEAIRDAEKWVQGGVLARVEDKPKAKAKAGVAAAAMKLSGKPVEKVETAGEDDPADPHGGSGEDGPKGARGRGRGRRKSE